MRNGAQMSLLRALTGDPDLCRTQEFIVPEIAAAQFIHDGSRFTRFMFRNGDSIMAVMVECGTQTVEGNNPLRLQESEKFLVDDANAF